MHALDRLAIRPPLPQGVMLCERPVAAQTRDTPFVPSSGTEKLAPAGLTPVKKVTHSCPCPPHVALPNVDAMRQVIAAQMEDKGPDVTAIHRKWLKELDATKTMQKDAEARAAEEAKARADAVSAFGERIRHAVLNGEKVSEFWSAAKKRPERPERPAPPTTVEVLSAAVAARAAADLEAKELLGGDVDDFVEGILKEAQEKLLDKKVPVAAKLGPSAVERPADGAAVEVSSSESPEVQGESHASGGGGRGGKKKGKNLKPAWALSEIEAEAVEEDEEKLLLSFAENLDFESFVEKLDDVELQDTFKVSGDFLVLDSLGGLCLKVLVDT